MKKYEEGERERDNLLLAMNTSPCQTQSSFRRQGFPGRLKSQAVQTSSVTTDGGRNKTSISCRSLQEHVTNA